MNAWNRLSLLALATMLVSSCGLELRYTKDELQRELAKQFPQQFAIERVGVVELVEPRLDLRAGSDRLFFDVGVVGRLGPAGKVRLAELGVSSAIAYDASNATFYAVEPRLEGVAVSGLGKSLESVLQRAANEALVLLGRLPLHRLDDDSAERRYLKKVEIRDEEVILTLGL